MDPRTDRINCQRKTILSVLGELHEGSGDIDVQGVYLKAKEKDRTISLPAVCRALAIFARQGLVRRPFVSTGRRLCEIAGPVEWHHFVCLGCNGMFDLSPVLGAEEKRALERMKVQIVAVEVTIKGFCGLCRSQRGLALPPAACLSGEKEKAFYEEKQGSNVPQG